MEAYGENIEKYWKVSREVAIKIDVEVIGP